MELWAIAGVICVLMFLIGLPFTSSIGYYLLDVFDHFVVLFALMIIGIVECLVVAWFYGPIKFKKLVKEETGQNLWHIITFIWMFITPSILVVLVIVQIIEEVKYPFGGYPTWALVMGWVAAFAPVAALLLGLLFPIPTLANIAYCFTFGCCRKKEKDLSFSHISNNSNTIGVEMEETPDSVTIPPVEGSDNEEYSTLSITDYFASYISNVFTGNGTVSDTELDVEGEGKETEFDDELGEDTSNLQGDDSNAGNDNNIEAHFDNNSQEETKNEEKRFLYK